MKKIWSWLTGDLVKSVMGGLDELFTSKEERIKAEGLIRQVMMEQALRFEEMKSEIITTEAKGNWLQRSWRPIIMLAFGFVVLYAKFIAPAFNLPNAELERDFWDLLQIGIGGYVVGRSLEKMTKDVAQNVNLNRKNHKQ